MLKKIISFIVCLVCTFSTCNALKMEILDGDFSYILDTSEKTATIRFIYISAHTKKEIVIPKYVTDYYGDKYLVTEIQENAMKQAINRIKSFIAREDFINNEKNFKALTWLLIYNVPFVSISADYESDAAEE